MQAFATSTDHSNHAPLVRAAVWPRLPHDVIRVVLNGIPRASRRAHSPILDPRWRCVARAVCREWRDIIEHPTSNEVRGIGRHPYRRWTRLHRTAPLNCPKWAAGRVMCMTLVADWVSARPDLWLDGDRDALYAWCAHNTGTEHDRATAAAVAALARLDGAIRGVRPHFPCRGEAIAPEGGATRKHVVAALCASGAPGAVEQALGWHWPLLHFACPCGDDGLNAMPWDFCSPAYEPSIARHASEYDGWDDETRGDADGLFHVLASVVARRGHISGLAKLAERFRISAPREEWLRDAIAFGRADLMEHLMRQGLQCNDREWGLAARTKRVACLARLLSLAQRHPCIIIPQAEDLRFAHVLHWPVDGAHADQPEAMALAITHGITFDMKLAFHEALRSGSVRALQWMYDQARDSPCENHPLRHTISDMHGVALTIVTSCGCRVKKRRAALAWLCDAVGYVPDEKSDQLRQLVTKACSVGHIDCALDLAERWPEALVRLGAKEVRALYATCLCGAAPGLNLMRLVVLIERAVGHNAATRRALVRELDFWGLILEISGAVENSHRPTAEPRIERCVLAVCCVALGETLRADDVANLVGMGPRPCSCTGRAAWRHEPRRGDWLSEWCAAEQPRGMMVSDALVRWIVPRPVQIDSLASLLRPSLPACAAPSNEDVGAPRSDSSKTPDDTNHASNESLNARFVAALAARGMLASKTHATV